MSEQVPARAIDKIVAHFVATKGRRHSIDTAWGFKVWWSPWTLGEKDYVFGDEQRFRPRTAARMLIIKAESEEGKRLFSQGDEFELLNESDSKEVVRVATEIMAKLNEDNAATQDGSAPKA